MQNFSYRTLVRAAACGAFLAALVSAAPALAFVEPASGTTPPASDVPAPINVGSATQLKTGVLQIQNFASDLLNLNSNQIWNGVDGNPLYLQWANSGGAVFVGGQAGHTNDLKVANGTAYANKFCINGGACTTDFGGTNYWTLDASGDVNTGPLVTGHIGADSSDVNGYAIAVPTGGIWLNGKNLNGTSLFAAGAVQVNGNVGLAGGILGNSQITIGNMDSIGSQDGNGLLSVVAGGYRPVGSNPYVYTNTRGAARITLNDGAMQFYVSPGTTGVAGQAIPWMQIVSINSTNFNIDNSTHNEKLCLNGGCITSFGSLGGDTLWTGSLTGNINNANTGNVGIGTASPDQKLTVSGSADLTGNLGTGGKSPTTGYPSSWGGGIHSWDIYGEGTVGSGPSGGIGGNGRASAEVTHSGDTGYVYSDQFCLWDNRCINAGNWPTAGTNYWTLAGTSLYNNSGTNIGVGDTDPAQKLDVNGYVRIRSTNGEGGTIQLEGNNGAKSYIENLNGTFRLLNSGWSAQLFSVDQGGNGSFNASVSAGANIAAGANITAGNAVYAGNLVQSNSGNNNAIYAPNGGVTAQRFCYTDGTCGATGDMQTGFHSYCNFQSGTLYEVRYYITVKGGLVTASHVTSTDSGTPCTYSSSEGNGDPGL